MHLRKTTITRVLHTRLTEVYVYARLRFIFFSLSLFCCVAKRIGRGTRSAPRCDLPSWRPHRLTAPNGEGSDDTTRVTSAERSRKSTKPCGWFWQLLKTRTYLYFTLICSQYHITRRFSFTRAKDHSVYARPWGFAHCKIWRKSWRKFHIFVDAFFFIQRIDRTNYYDTIPCWNDVFLFRGSARYAIETSGKWNQREIWINWA